MKRFSNLFAQIISIENLRAADSNAQKGKSRQYGVQIHNRKAEQNLQLLHLALKNKTFATSKYDTFKIYEPKERIIFRLPYYPDRIVHHAIMNVLESIFVSTFTADTYSCIKGKGIHAASSAVKQVLRYHPNETQYCLKLDIKKFYPSVDHKILKQLIRRKIKDAELLQLLDGIIDSAEGLPIGNYLSQYLANFYLTYFDHWLKESQQVKYYFRYADDMVVLHYDKHHLHNLLSEIRNYLQQQLKLTVKENYQVFPVESRGIDFVGYVHYHTHTLIRKGIKKNFVKAAKRNNKKSLASYTGWLKHCNSKTLIQKHLKVA